MNNPLHSVCVPAYNHERYIQACLESIFRQTYPNIELIIIDDGSFDRTYQIAAAFVENHGERFARIELHRQTNQGVARTFNRLLELARGDWIHFIASDDILYPRKIQAQWEAVLAFGDSSLAMVHGDIDEIDADGKVLLTRNINRPKPGLVRKAYENLLLRNEIYAPTAAIKRTALLELGGYDTSLAIEDLDCWLRLSRKFAIARVPEVMCGYRIHGNNLSQKKPLLLAAHLETHGKFLTNYSHEVSTSTQRRCFQKDSHRVLRWAKYNRRSALPRVIVSRIISFFRTPGPQKYFDFAQIIRTSQ